MTKQVHRHGNWRAVYGMPIIIGTLASVGLLSALLYTGPGRIVAWFAVGLPLAIVVWVYTRARR